MELLLGTILIDTVNLDPVYKKVTKKDEEVAEQLRKPLGIDTNAQVMQQIVDGVL